jgi:hypothetical protein
VNGPVCSSDYPIRSHQPYPCEDAIQVAIEDLSPTIPKLKEMKVADFIDVTPRYTYEGS